MNIIIRPKRTIYNYCTSKKETYEMTPKQRLQLNRYLNKYFRKFWQETNAKHYFLVKLCLKHTSSMSCFVF